MVRGGGVRLPEHSSHSHGDPELPLDRIGHADGHAGAAEKTAVRGFVGIGLVAFDDLTDIGIGLAFELFDGDGAGQGCQQAQGGKNPIKVPLHPKALQSIRVSKSGREFTMAPRKGSKFISYPKY